MGSEPGKIKVVINNPSLGWDYFFLPLCCLTYY